MTWFSHMYKWFFNIRLYESRFWFRSKIDLHISLINCLSDMLTIKIAIWVLQLPLTLHFWKIGFQQVIVQLCQVVILVVKNIKNIIMQGRLVLYRRMVDNGIQWYNITMINEHLLSDAWSHKISINYCISDHEKPTKNCYTIKVL